MYKRLIIYFLKDRIVYIIGNIISLMLMLLYMYLAAGIKELFYPLSLWLFISIIIFIIDGFRYCIFYGKLNKNDSIEYFDLDPASKEQLMINEAIFELHQYYLKEINNINAGNTSNQHLISQWIHNMKTPVSVIGLILQKLRMKNLLEEDLLKDLEEENLKLTNGLEQILNIMRLEEFFRDYEPEAVDLVKLLKEVINSKKSQFIYNNVFPKLNLEYDKVMIVTDSKWNKFMLDQIISNAIKYSADENLKKIVNFNIKRTFDKVILEIEDEGIGIPEYDLNRIFQPFFTGDNGRKYKNSTGIGLYICGLIAEKLGHEIKVEATVGVGTKVTIEYMNEY